MDLRLSMVFSFLLLRSTVGCNPSGAKNADVQLCPMPFEHLDGSLNSHLDALSSQETGERLVRQRLDLSLPIRRTDYF